ncbi:MAG: hypothetical protein HYS27_14080 [Deltaproteobacteria bacterium]|nr:hypothetical protein [Deltaproteobacteria bacterium]
MTPTTMTALAPAGIWLVAAIACLALEAAGTPVGWRKRSTRTHLPWVIGLAAAAVIAHALLAWPSAATAAASAQGLVIDRIGLLGGAVIALLVGAVHLAATPALAAIDEERGEMSAGYAMVGAALSVACITVDLLVLAAALTIAAAAQSLLCAPDREGPHGIEAATKGIVGAGVVLVLLAVGATFLWVGAGETGFAALGRSLAIGAPSAGLATATVIVVLALVIGAVPFQQSYVDVAHGASTSSAGLLSGGMLVVGATEAVRLLDGVVAAGPHTLLARTLAAVAVLTLVGAPVASLDQTRIGRVVAYLAVLPGGVVLAALGAGALGEGGAPDAGAVRAALMAVLSGGLGCAAALLGVAIPRLNPSSTWEDWSGFGRTRPVMAAFLVYALGTLAGAPGTVGFTARLEAARALFSARMDWLGLVVVASAALGAAPIVRLALFLFAKDVPSTRRDAREAPLGGLLVGTFAVLVVACGVLEAWPGLLDSLVQQARR